MICCFNGRLLPVEEVRISPFDRGFTLGDGLFETLRAYNGRVFRLGEHLDRLRQAAAILELVLPGDLEQAIAGVIAANHWREATLRLTISRGEAIPTRGGILPDPAMAPTVLITGRDLSGQPPYPARVYSAGLRLIISGPARDEQSPMSGLKTLNYLPQIMLRQEAARQNSDDALQLNRAGQVVETSVANIFLVRRETLITPDLTSGCLPGVTRATVLELAAAAGLTVRQRGVALAELLQADEIFLTNSLLELAPVAAIDTWLAPVVPGAITTLLRRAYQALIQASAN